jgi:hypothetical protein
MYDSTKIIKIFDKLIDAINRGKNLLRRGKNDEAYQKAIDARKYCKQLLDIPYIYEKKKHYKNIDSLYNELSTYISAYHKTKHKLARRFLYFSFSIIGIGLLWEFPTMLKFVGSWFGFAGAKEKSSSGSVSNIFFARENTRGVQNVDVSLEGEMTSINKSKENKSTQDCQSIFHDEKIAKEEVFKLTDNQELQTQLQQSFDSNPVIKKDLKIIAFSNCERDMSVRYQGINETSSKIGARTKIDIENCRWIETNFFKDYFDSTEKNQQEVMDHETRHSRASVCMFYRFKQASKITGRNMRGCYAHVSILEDETNSYRTARNEFAYQMFSIADRIEESKVTERDREAANKFFADRVTSMGEVYYTQDEYLLVSQLKKINGKFEAPPYEISKKIFEREVVGKVKIVDGKEVVNTRISTKNPLDAFLLCAVNIINKIAPEKDNPYGYDAEFDAYVFSIYSPEFIKWLSPNFYQYNERNTQLCINAMIQP